MLQGYTMAIVPCGNPTPKKLPTGGGEWPTFRTARAQRVHSARTAHGTPPKSKKMVAPDLQKNWWSQPPKKMVAPDPTKRWPLTPRKRSPQAMRKLCPGPRKTVALEPAKKMVTPAPGDMVAPQPEKMVAPDPPRTVPEKMVSPRPEKLAAHVRKKGWPRPQPNGGPVVCSE